MVDKKPLIVEKLSLILPTKYELFVDRAAALPCITYIENNNYATQTGDTVSYSNVSYTIKLWGKQLQTMASYASSIDNTLTALGLKRTAYRELAANDVICFVFTYEGVCQEGASAWY